MEQKQRATLSMVKPSDKYSGTKTDTWLDAGAMLGMACGLSLVIISLTTLLPVLEWLGAGAWTTGVILFWTRAFRWMWWNANKQFEKAENITALRIKRIIAGICIIIFGLLMTEALLNSLHSSHVYLLIILFAGLYVWGLGLIVLAIRSKRKRYS